MKRKRIAIEESGRFAPTLFRLSPEDVAALNRIAVHYGESRAEVLRKWIRRTARKLFPEIRNKPARKA